MSHVASVVNEAIIRERTAARTVTNQNVSGGTATGQTLTAEVVSGDANQGFVISKTITFTENATNTTHTGSVVLPARSTLHNIQVTNKVLWTGGTATLKVGDTADDDGYFIGVDMKATDLVIGENLTLNASETWGGKQGAYLVAATGRIGPTTTNFGMYYEAGSTITGVITVGTPATTAGRSFMTVTYSVGEITAATGAGP